MYILQTPNEEMLSNSEISAPTNCHIFFDFHFELGNMLSCKVTHSVLNFSIVELDYDYDYEFFNRSTSPVPLMLRFRKNDDAPSRPY